MTFLTEIKRALGASDGEIEYFVSAQGAYFSGVKRIAELGEEKIVLKGKKQSVSVEGAGLYLSKYAFGDVMLHGTVFKIEKT